MKDLLAKMTYAELRQLTPEERKRRKYLQIRRATAKNPAKYQERGRASYHRTKLRPGRKEELKRNCDRSRSKRHAENPKRYWLQTALSHARVRARKNGIAFDLDLTLATPDVCPYLGTPLRYARGVSSRGPQSPSIDRIDNRLGYTKNNCEVISARANTIKSDARAAELIAIAQRLDAIERTRDFRQKSLAWFRRGEAA